MDSKQVRGQLLTFYKKLVMFYQNFLVFYKNTIQPHVQPLVTFLKKHRPVLDSKVVTILTALYLLLFTNFTFWKKGLDYFSSHPFQLFVFAIALFLVHIIVLLLFSVKYVLKPVFVFFIIVAAVASHFVDSYGTLIDTDMIRNAATTTGNEAKHLLTFSYFFHLFLYGLVPSALLVWTKVTYRPFKSKLFHDSLLGFGSAILAAILMVSYYASYASTFREKKDFMGSLNPVAPLVSTGKYVKSFFKNRNIIVQPVGLDAHKGALSASLPQKRLTIIVAGETARAQNFSLNGYKRETNPGLRARNVIHFDHVTSCGTATAVSLPCMFSNLTHQNFTHHKGLSRQNVADVLTHAGIKVEWWDNNTGDKGVGKRIRSINISRDGDPKHCQDGECRDSIFLKYLKDYLKTPLTQDTVLILHQIGSHGPTYYLRYPKEFEHFKPACQTAEFIKCGRQKIINAYDNTILFTDHILSQTIDLLKSHKDDFSSSMIYMSDHGESLGEYGMYLHGFPYRIAPDTQTHVPFMAWFSESFAKNNHLDLACIRAKQKTPTSHDTLFHSILGMMDIQTRVYKKDMDIFASCRTP